MSGSVRSGLIFGLAGLILVVVVGFIPGVGPFVCGPLTALIIGGVAGYFGARWSVGKAGAGKGALAGTIAGIGTLIGAVIAVIIFFNTITNSPEFQSQFNEAFREALEQQQPGSGVNPEDAQGIIGLAGPIGGVIFGVVNLIGALIGGLIGGLIGRHEPAVVPTDYPQSVPPTL